jgi:hypothetical protein
MSAINIQKITRLLLDHFIVKESKCVDEYRWYFNNEFDSNVVAAEALGNSRQLGIMTKLSLDDAKIIIYLMNAILQENNYLMFENGLDTYIDDEDDVTLTAQYEDDKCKLCRGNDAHLWIKYLRISTSDTDISQYDVKEGIDSNFLTTRFKDFGQHIFMVDKININLRILKSGIVTIEH